MKRLIDCVVAIGILVLFAPVMLVVAVGILVTMGRPIFFEQTRPGRQEQPFQLLKFRTMREAVDASGRTLDDASRLTSFGRFLRKTSLDELPELWNVLRGDMSLVGPRPLLMKYQPYYTDLERLRFTVRPGITGWAQIHGRNRATWDARLANDVWYVQHQSVWLDLRILMLTARSVVRRVDVVEDTRSIMDDLDIERKVSLSGTIQEG